MSFADSYTIPFSILLTAEGKDVALSCKSLGVKASSVPIGALCHSLSVLHFYHASSMRWSRQKTQSGCCRQQFENYALTIASNATLL